MKREAPPAFKLHLLSSCFFLGKPQGVVSLRQEGTVGWRNCSASGNRVGALFLRGVAPNHKLGFIPEHHQLPGFAPQKTPKLWRKS